MHKMKMMVIVGAIVIFTAGTVFAQPMEGENVPRQKDVKEAIHKKLGLTPEQQQKLEENRKAQTEAMKKLHEGMKQQREKLQEALKSPETTRASVEPIIAEMKSLQAQLIDQRMNGIFAAKSILTPEQFVKFTEMTEKHVGEGKGGMRERFKDRRGKHRNRENDDLLGGPSPSPED